MLFCKVIELTLSSPRPEPTKRASQDVEILLNALPPRIEGELHPVAYVVGDRILKTVQMTLAELKDWPRFRALSCAHLCNFEGYVWQHWCSLRKFFMQKKYDQNGVSVTKLSKLQAEKVWGFPILSDEYSDFPLFALFCPSMVPIVSDTYLGLI